MWKSTMQVTLIAAAILTAGVVMDVSRDSGFVVSSAEAVIGRPWTPLSYAGVARRTTVRAETPGLGAPGVGVAPGVGYGGIGGPASGVGVLPGAGAGQAGIGYSGGVGVNLGGPVNRVGIR